jgi:hypothetical protein
MDEKEVFDSKSERETTTLLARLLQSGKAKRGATPVTSTNAVQTIVPKRVNWSQSDLRTIARVKSRDASMGSSSAGPVSEAKVVQSTQSVDQVLQTQQKGNSSMDITTDKIRSAVLVTVGLLLVGAAVFLGTRDMFPEKARIRGLTIAATAQKDKDEAAIDLVKAQTKLAETTHAIPPGWTPQPTVAPVAPVAQPQETAPALTPIPNGGMQRTITQGQRTILSQNRQYNITGSNDPEVMAAMLTLPYEIISIEGGEYRMVYHYNPSDETGWVKAGGPIPEHVKRFLEVHRQVPGSSELIQLYTRGPVIFRT